MASSDKPSSSACVAVQSFRMPLGFTALALALMTWTATAVPHAKAAEGDTSSTTLRKIAPSALQGDREAVRDAAKAIVKLGPREFKGADQMRPLLRNEAMRGSSAAANAYGMMLQHGIGGPANPAEAPQWYSRGASDGNISASKSGAFAYALGWGVRRDVRKAQTLLAAVPVDQRARKMLQISKALLRPGHEEPEAALMWLQRAVALRAGSPDDAARIGARIEEIEPGSAEEMRIWLAPLAAKGNGAAAMMLASAMMDSGKPEDQTEAVRLYLLAAEQGVDGAYQALGTLLTSGPKEAAAPVLSLLEQKARGGIAPAQVILAHYYVFQSGEEQDLRKKGVDYLQQAAREGNPEAQYRLAMLILTSVEDQDKRALAKAYLVLAAKGGNRLAGIAVAQLGSVPLQQARQIVKASIQ